MDPEPTRPLYADGRQPDDRSRFGTGLLTFNMPGRVLIVINYRSAVLTAQAIATARLASSRPLTVVVVDNSCDQRESAALATAGADLLISAPHNLGFAGGINLGLSQSSGEEIVISNPDVEFFGSSIDRLFESLVGAFELAGPKFVWDRNGELLLPPAQVDGRASLLDTTLSSRSRGWKGISDRRRIRARLAFWRTVERTPVNAVSGAVMAFRRSLVARIGAFDERFRLYFEEIDFQRRMRSRGDRIVYVPDSVCRHLYNQSAASTESAARSFDESEAAYHSKWGTGSFHGMTKRWRRPDAAPGFEDRDPLLAIPLAGGTSAVLAEASPLASFRSAAGAFPSSSSFLFPADVWESYKGSELFLRIVNLESLKPVAHYRFVKGR